MSYVNPCCYCCNKVSYKCFDIFCLHYIHVARHCKIIIKVLHFVSLWWFSEVITLNHRQVTGVLKICWQDIYLWMTLNSAFATAIVSTSFKFFNVRIFEDLNNFLTKLLFRTLNWIHNVIRFLIFFFLDHRFNSKWFPCWFKIYLMSSNVTVLIHCVKFITQITWKACVEWEKCKNP